MRADPQNPNWTVFEQTMTISISGMFGNTVKSQLESFAEGLFLSSAESGTKILEETLAEEAARIADAANKADGGGVWWTGGAETAPGANMHSAEPAVPEDSSSGFLSETLESWTNWMWPSQANSSGGGDAESQGRGSRVGPNAALALGSVWWYDGDEGGAFDGGAIELVQFASERDGMKAGHGRTTRRRAHRAWSARLRFWLRLSFPCPDVPC